LAGNGLKKSLVFAALNMSFGLYPLVKFGKFFFHSTIAASSTLDYSPESDLYTTLRLFSFCPSSNLKLWSLSNHQAYRQFLEFSSLSIISFIGTFAAWAPLNHLTKISSCLPYGDLFQCFLFHGINLISNLIYFPIHPFFCSRDCSCHKNFLRLSKCCFGSMKCIKLFNDFGFLSNRKVCFLLVISAQKG